jgi:mevalonate kinase
MTTFASARGKVILVGEHAVVHGLPAVAVAISRGARARAERAARHELHVASWGVRIPPDEHTELGRAFRAVLAATPTEHPVRIDLSTNLPPGAGLGCSAALGVATVRALDPRAPHEVQVRRAMEWERVFHGNPSGVDAEVAARGGCVVFRVGSPVEAIGLSAPLILCVGDSGQASSTGAMVAAVAARGASERDAVFAELGRLAEEARALLTRGAAGLGGVLSRAHAALGRLGVSTPALDAMCRTAEDAGALGAKLTGAGGGGCVVALAPDPQAASRIRRAWQRDGFESFTTRVQERPENDVQPVVHIEERAS